jgi:Ca-activated chloride channel family protein
MQRWHLTVGLGALALVAAIVAPRLTGFHSSVATPLPPTPPEPPTVPVVVEPTPVVVTPGPGDAGHLVLDAGLDKTAVIEGGSDERFLAITISAPADIGHAFRRPLDVGVVMDISGSMSARGKIDYAKRAAKQLGAGIESTDTYSLVTFSDDATTVIPAMHVTDPTVINHAVDRIYEGGGTNLYAGLVKGSDEITRALTGENIGRVILLSDGMANVGIQDPDTIARFAAQLQGQGITVSAIGLGLDYNEDLLSRIADLGGGTYNFVDDPSDLAAVFDAELEHSASVVARGTHVEITLPADVEPVELIGWTATPTAHGWIVDAGDVYAGDAKKVVARVRVHGGAVGTQPVAAVVATYTDIVDNIDGRAHADVAATVTRDVAVVDRSVSVEHATVAAKAWGNSFLDKASRAYERGDIAEASQLANQGSAVLQENGAALAAPDLIEDADNLQVQRHNYEAAAPSSDEGRRAIKQSKEDYYDRAR